MKRILLLLAFILVFLGVFSISSWAETAYVTDRFKVTFRSGPSVDNKVVRMLPSGQELEVLDTQGDWSHVRIAGEEGDGSDGWILSRFLVERLPWEKKAALLEQQNQELSAKLAASGETQKAASTQVQQLSGDLKKAQTSLQGLKKRYDNLKKGASSYLALKEDFNGMKSALESSQKKVTVLSDENAKLRSSERRKWFITGALVLLCGWLIGLLMGKKQRRRRSIYD